MLFLRVIAWCGDEKFSLKKSCFYLYIRRRYEPGRNTPADSRRVGEVRTSPQKPYVHQTGNHRYLIVPHHGSEHTDYNLITENKPIIKGAKAIICCTDNKEATQGKDGVYFGHGTREIATVRSILLGKELTCDADTIDMLISAVADTLLISKEGISTKLDAIALLICIVVKYPEGYTRNQEVYEKLFEQQKTIEVADNSIISSNIDSISLKIGLQLLYTAMGKDVYAEILELIPYIRGDVATTIAVTHLIAEYLENSDNVMFPSKVEAIILQNILQWLHSEYADIR